MFRRQQQVPHEHWCWHRLDLSSRLAVGVVLRRCCPWVPSLAKPGHPHQSCQGLHVPAPVHLAFFYGWLLQPVFPRQPMPPEAASVATAGEEALPPTVLAGNAGKLEEAAALVETAGEEAPPVAVLQVAAGRAALPEASLLAAAGVTRRVGNPAKGMPVVHS